MHGTSWGDSLRIQVPRCALDVGRHVAAVLRAQPREAKVSDLCGEGVIEKDVGGLDVSVDDGRAQRHVEELNACTHVVRGQDVRRQDEVKGEGGSGEEVRGVMLRSSTLSGWVWCL